MPIGDGMNVSVGLSMTLTGFEMLSQIATQLESLQGLAARTEAAFNQMGAAYARSMAAGTAEARRAAGIMEQMNQTTGRRATPAEAMGTATPPRERFVTENVIPPGGISGIQAMQGLRRQRMEEEGIVPRQLPQVQRRHIAMINDEISARQNMIDNLKSGIMAGVGVTAAMEIANLARTATHAIGQLDERMAAMRMTGIPQVDIERSIQQATQMPVHGVNIAERLFLGQEIGALVGHQSDPETTRNLAITARAVTRITGQGDLQGNLRDVVRAADSMGNIVNARGELDQRLLQQNALVVEKMIAATGGFVNAQTAMHNLRIAGPTLAGLDLRNNPRAQAQMTVLMEQQGSRAGDTVNNMMSASQGLTKLMLSGDRRISSIRSILQAELTNIPGANVFGRMEAAHRAIEQMPQIRNLPPEKRQEATFGMEQVLFGTRAARGMEQLFSRTGEEQVERTQKRIALLGSSFEDLDKESQNFNDGLLAVKASFESLATSMVQIGGITHLLYQFSDALDHITAFLRQHQAIAKAFTDLATFAAGLAALRIGAKGLGFLFGTGGRAAAGAVAGAGVGAGIGAGAAAAETGIGATATGAVEGLAIGTMFGRGAPALISGLARLAGTVTGAIPGLLALGFAAWKVNEGLTSFGDWVAKLLGRTPERQKAIDDLDKKGGEQFWSALSGLAERLWKGPFAAPDNIGPTISGDMRERNEPPRATQQQTQQTQEQARRAMPNAPRSFTTAPTRIPLPMPRDTGPYGAYPAGSRPDIMQRLQGRPPQFGGLQQGLPPGVTPRVPMSTQPTPMLPPTPPQMPPVLPQTPPQVAPGPATMAPGIPAAPQFATVPTAPNAAVQPLTPTSINTGMMTVGTLVVRSMPGGAGAQPAIFRGGSPSPIQNAALTGAGPGAAQPPIFRDGLPASPIQNAALMGNIPGAAPMMFGGGLPAPTVQNTAFMRGGPAPGPGAAPTWAFHGHGIQRVPGTSPGNPMPPIMGGAPATTGIGTPTPGLGTPELPSTGQGSVNDFGAVTRPSPFDRLLGPGISGTRHGPDSMGGDDMAAFARGGSRAMPQHGGPHGPIGIRGSAPLDMSRVKGAPFAGSSNQFFQSMRGDVGHAAEARGLSPQAQKVLGTLGASVSSLETGYGKHFVGNNFFGIKAGGGVGSGSVGAATTEVIGGRTVGQNAQFAAFGNQAESAQGFVDFMMKNPRYHQVLEAANRGDTAGAYAALGASGYATDPNYADKIASIGKTYGSPSMPNIQGPKPDPQQADVPASQLHVTINSQHNLDGDQIASTVANHFIGGGPTASSSGTVYDSKMMPTVPGFSSARW